MSVAGRALIWVLLVMAAIAGIGLPIYRAGSQSTASNPGAPAQADPEIVDQGAVVTSNPSPSDDIQIPTRLTVHTNGTVSVWFQGQTNGAYRIDYAETKAATLAEMIWKVAADNIPVVTNSWTEWVDAGVTDRPAPKEVSQRYYRVVLKTNLTAIVAEQIIQQSPTGQVSALVAVSTTNNGNSSATVPAEILQILQKQGVLSQWSQSPSARYLQELQECESLGELVAGGQASEGALRDALAKSKLRISMLMTLGENLFRSENRHDAQLFFEAIVQSHANRATAKQIARSYLWLGKIHQDIALDRQYVKREPDQAKPEFEAAAANYLAAKDSSRDWVRGSSWLAAAACYRELGDQERRRGCLQQLITEQESQTQQTAVVSSSTSQVDKNVGPRQRDIANSLLADSYFEEGRWVEAGQTYQQMLDRLGANRSDVAEQYPGQKQYLDQLNTSLRWCTARQIEKAVSVNEMKAKAAP